MMEIRFCPHCGAARQGAFCGGCGFRFESLGPIAVVGASEPPVQGEEFVGTGPMMTGTEIEQPSFPIPFGMQYGESFDQTQDCWNCGAEAQAGACGLCGFSRA